MRKNNLVLLSLMASMVLCSANPIMAADFSGTWCVKGDSKECALLRVQGDKVNGEFRNSGSKTVDLTGYQHGNSLAMSFRNARKEIGSWMAVQRKAGEIDAVCLNPDGSERWKATYVKR